MCCRWPTAVRLRDRPYRGGLEKGERWRKGGPRDTKVTRLRTSSPSAEYLAKEGYTSRGRFRRARDSAGGLLMGAVANMRPDLFAGIVARVPFVDASTRCSTRPCRSPRATCRSGGIPIRDVAAYRLIASYAPYENVKAQAYRACSSTAASAIRA